jgi:hypothetical protein
VAGIHVIVDFLVSAALILDVAIKRPTGGALARLIENHPNPDAAAGGAAIGQVHCAIFAA